MYNHTIEYFSNKAVEKVSFLSQHPMSFAVGAMMAGVYVGLGIILILSVASGLDPGIQKLVMGFSFGLALTLVVFAGSELFTGHTMYMVFGRLKRVVTTRDLMSIWITAWSFNFIGALILVTIYWQGGGVLLGKNNELLLKVAEYKTDSTAIALVARAILCNWLVCLALWMCARTKSDAAKCIFIFWCLMGFIASGYEHSVANMTLLSLALIADQSGAITVSGVMHNLFWVTIGNIIGGSVFMGLGYWVSSGNKLHDQKKISRNIHHSENDQINQSIK